jgi:hypothetical protein
VRKVSRVTVQRVVACPFSEAHDYAEEFLREAERGVAVHVPLRDLIPHLNGKIRQPVRLVFASHPDEIEAGRLHDAIVVEWHASTKLFPRFHGTLRLRIASVDSTRLTLEGAYRAPFGVLGRIFDAIVGRRIARATMREFLDRLADSIERCEREARASLGEARAGNANVAVGGTDSGAA